MERDKYGFIFLVLMGDDNDMDGDAGEGCTWSI
jgi:hypothetical protein